MKITIATGGTRGDVQPYVALGRGLRAAGYAVQVLATDDFEGLVTDAGLEFRSIGTSIESMLQNEEWRATTESGSFLKVVAHMNREMKRQAGELARRLPDLVRGSTLLIAGMGGIGGVFAAAQHMNVPFVQAYLFPVTPTVEFPGPLTPGLRFGGIANRLSFRVMQQMLWQSTRVADVTTRQLIGMRRGSRWGPFTALERTRHPTLYGYSGHVIPRPGDWGDHIHVTGYWFLDPPSGWQPPADLLDFLAAGPPPVYIGFGSMGSRSPAEAAQLALEALALSGQRGIIASGWGGLTSTDLPSTVYAIKEAPHAWLFPRMGAVVHHGGAGTTAAGLRAGIPSILVPFMGDQPYWGHRVAALGVGTSPIPRKQLTAEKLARAIEVAVTDSAMRERAAALGEKISAENGVESAVMFVRRFQTREQY